MGGTGGRFLGAFLYAAREQCPLKMFTKRGSACYLPQDRYKGSVLGVGYAPNIHISKLLENPVLEITQYIPCHMTDCQLLSTYFSKVIEITFTADDYDKLRQIFYCKWSIDEGHGKKFTDIEFDNIYFKPQKSSHQLLSVSWQELMFQPPAIFIQHLSEFTLIPASNFPLHALENWRSLTLKNLCRS
jgi:hypothetical protein